MSGFVRLRNGLAKQQSDVYNYFYRARRGSSGALYLKSAAAGLDSRPEAYVCEAGFDKER